MNKIILFFIAAILLVTSCSDELNKSLDYSGANRPELEKVLEHFKEDSNPTLPTALAFHITQPGRGRRVGVYTVTWAWGLALTLQLDSLCGRG